MRLLTSYDRMALDLVCKQEINSEDTRFFTEYGNNQYFFCSADCKRAFDDHPDHYIREQARKDLHL